MRQVGAANAEDWPRPSTVEEHEFDPASGLLLVDGCRPERGRARTELYVRGHEPAGICPAGSPTEVERGVFAQVGGWFGAQWRRFSRWLTRHFGTEEPQPTPREGDYLGVPRLPRAVDIEIEQPRIDSLPPVPLGVPVPIPLPDTGTDTLRLDTLPPPDTLVRPRPDTVRPVRPDTLALGQGWRGLPVRGGLHFT
jgi:hypothetical protein